MFNKYNTKGYTLFLIIFLTTAFSFNLAAQERVAYRVEVIVLRLINSQFPPDSSLEPRDFSGFLDLVERQLELEQWQSDWQRMSPEQLAELEVSPPLTALATRFPDIEGISFIQDRSERMSAVWRNLRLSAEYRPEAYLSWVQAAEGDFPALRIRNNEVVLVRDAHAMQRVAPPPAEPEDPPWQQKVFIYDIEQGSLMLEPVPGPGYFYSVDGTVRLRRSRFLHIDLDIEYRLPTPATLEGYSGAPLLLKHQGYHVFSNVQTRQIRSGRMEYFDSPVLGILVWVTPIERVEEEQAR